MLSIFYGSIKDGSGIVEEVVMPIHVTPGGEPSRDAEHDARVFEEENSGEASWEEAVAYIGPRFEEMNRAARDEFSRRLRERVEAHRRHRAGLVEELRKDLALFERDRRQEIEEEIRAAAGVEVSQATLAEFGGGEFRRRFDARLAALSDAVRERQEEIRAFMEVEVAENPKPMAAVILLPEVGAQ